MLSSHSSDEEWQVIYHEMFGIRKAATWHVYIINMLYSGAN